MDPEFIGSAIKEGGVIAGIVSAFYFVERIIGKVTFKQRSGDIIDALNDKMEKVHRIVTNYDDNGKNKLNYVYENMLKNEAVLEEILESVKETAKSLDRTVTLLEKFLYNGKSHNV